jgi:hypothetical protein
MLGQGHVEFSLASVDRLIHVSIPFLWLMGSYGLSHERVAHVFF